jgi:hypothetical protein
MENEIFYTLVDQNEKKKEISFSSTITLYDYQKS